MSATAVTPPAGKPVDSKKLGLGGVGAVVALVGALGGPIPAVVIALALLGTPLFAVMGGAAELAWLAHPEERSRFLRFIASDVYGSQFAGSPILTTIPLFTFVGYVLAESKTPERLVRAATAWVGWMPGGLAIVCVVASAIFTLFTGGSGVTIIAVGGLLYPALRKQGYSDKFALGLVTAGGSVGLLLPYSLPLLVFSLVSGLNFELAFKSVILPGLFVLGLLAAYSAWVGLRENIPRNRFDAKEALASLWDFKWELGIPVILVVGLKLLHAEIDECAGLVALYAVVVELFVHRDLQPKKDLVRIVRGSMSLAGALILILGMANALMNWVEHEHIPRRVLDAMLTLGLDKTWQFLVVMNAFLLVLGMVMDGFSAILVAAPIVLPFAAHFGLGPFHVAIMFVLNLELAFCTPPLGLNLFIASFRFNRPVVDLYKIALPFVGLLALALGVVMFVPRISDGLVQGDIAERRARDVALGVPPREAWTLECVQHDRSNPQPCSAEDKATYPNGEAAADAPVDAGAPVPGGGEDDEDESLVNLLRGGDAAAPAPTTGGDDEEDLLALIKGDADAGADAAPPPKPTPAPGQETEEDLLNLIKGN